VPNTLPRLIWPIRSTDRRPSMLKSRTEGNPSAGSPLTMIDRERPNLPVALSLVCLLECYSFPAYRRGPRRACVDVYPEVAVFVIAHCVSTPC
jgi:hypothetical protein